MTVMPAKSSLLQQISGLPQRGRVSWFEIILIAICVAWVAFDIAPNGIPVHLRVVKSSDKRWEMELLAAMGEGWRFRPGTVDGKPVAVPAWFEFVRGSHSPIPPALIPKP